jgi:hypothetical protein
MSVCWTVLLPLIIAYIMIFPCYAYILNYTPMQGM